jgi:hypothetical protein
MSEVERFSEVVQGTILEILNYVLDVGRRAGYHDRKIGIARQRSGEQLT